MDVVTAANSSGLSGNWAFSTGSAKYFTYQTAGLSMAGYGGETGGSTRFTIANFAPSDLQRQLSTPLTYGTYYQSALFNISNLGNTGSFNGVLLGSAGSNGNSAAVTLSGDEFTSTLGGSRVGGTASVNTGTARTANTTYAMFNRIVFSSGSLTIDRYVLTESQLVWFKANGGLDALLNQSLLTGTQTGRVLQLGTQTRATAATSLPYLILEGYANNALYAFRFDEIRMNNDGFNTLVPEPAGLAAVGLVGLVLARRRRI